MDDTCCWFCGDDAIVEIIEDEPGDPFAVCLDCSDEVTL